MNRIERLKNRLPYGWQGVLVTTETNREYMVSFLSSAGTLLVFPGQAYFIIDSRYVEAAKKHVVGAEVILQEKLYSQIGELCRRHSATELLCETERSKNPTKCRRSVLPRQSLTLLFWRS